MLLGFEPCGQVLLKYVYRYFFAVIPGSVPFLDEGSCLAERSFPEHFEDEFVDILVSVVKAEFAFFQMEIKSVFCQPSKAHKTRLGESPKTFNAINMRVFIGKFVVAMLHSEVLLIPQIDQAIIAAPAV